MKQTKGILYDPTFINLYQRQTEGRSGVVWGVGLRSMMRLLGVMEVFIVLIVVMISRVLTYVKQSDFTP